MSSPLPGQLDAAQYARQVRAALGELPAAPHEDLLEDLAEHLAEVAAEGEGSLEAKLGPPAAYAQELCRAAGLVGSAACGAPAPLDRLRQAALRLAGRDDTRAVLAFLPELRPAWWVLRAWLAAAALSYLAGSRFLLLPFGPLLGVPVLAAAVVLSVRLGRWAQRRPPADPRQRLAAAGGNALLALFALIALVGVQQQDTRTVYAGPGPAGYGPGYGQSATLTRPDGTPITNIYPYSAAGQPLTDVLLYDQDGRALDNLSTTTPDGTAIERVVPPGAPPPRANAYPQRQRVTGYDGQPPPSGAPQDLVPAPTAPPTALPTGPGPSAPPETTTAPAPPANPPVTPAATGSPQPTTGSTGTPTPGPAR